jgi:hypothetical protein
MGEKSDGSTASYYELPKDATQLQHLISYRDMNGQIATIFSACYRYGMASHSDKLRDAKKILFYAQAEVERLEKYGKRSNMLEGVSLGLLDEEALRQGGVYLTPGVITNE